MPASDLSVLGLSEGASQADIKKAYRRLARQLHPDLTGDQNTQRFQELHAAYIRLTESKTGDPAGGKRSANADGSRRPSSGMSSATESFFRDLGATVASKGAEHARVVLNQKVRGKGKLAQAAAALLNVAIEEGEAVIGDVLRNPK